MYERKLSTKSASGFVRYNGKIWPDPNSKDEMNWMHEQLHKAGLDRYPLFKDNDIHKTLIDLYSNPNTNEKVRKIKDRWRSRVSKEKSNKIQLNLSISKKSHKEINQITTNERKTASDLIEELLQLRRNFNTELQEAIADEKQNLSKELNDRKTTLNSKIGKALLVKQVSPYIPNYSIELQHEITALKEELTASQKKMFTILKEFENILQGEKDIKET